jgi:hypothetical protein
MSIRGENSIELMGEEDARTRRENEINQKQGLTIARGSSRGSGEEVFAELWRGGAGQGGVGRGRAEAGVRAQGRAAVIGISQGEGERSMRNDLSGREVQEWSEPSRDGLQGAEGGGKKALCSPLIPTGGRRRATLTRTVSSCLALRGN